MKIQSSYCNFENIFIAKIASKFVYKGRVAIWSLPPSPLPPVNLKYVFYQNMLIITLLPVFTKLLTKH